LVGFAVVNFDIVDWPWLKVKASLKVQGLVVADYFILDSDLFLSFVFGNLVAAAVGFDFVNHN